MPVRDEIIIILNGMGREDFTKKVTFELPQKVRE